MTISLRTPASYHIFSNYAGDGHWSLSARWNCREPMAMMERSEIHEGGCLCGAVRYVVHGSPESSNHCHCRSCQRAVGAGFATWCAAKNENFKVTKGEIKICKTSPGIERGFCSNCGTSLTYVAKQEWSGQDWTGMVWFLAPTLDDPSIVSPTGHFYVSHQQPWVKLNDGLPTFEKF